MICRGFRDRDPGSSVGSVSFDVPADAYDRFMGRFSRPLAPLFVDAAGVRSGQRALDVGCGPGALTEVLVERLGADAVVGVEPSPPFLAAARTRLPDVELHEASAEDLPFDEGSFDATLAQLVVHFMSDPVAGLREMGRVTRPGGVVAACVWDHGGGSGPLSTFWRAATQVDPSARGEGHLPGSSDGDLPRLAHQAGLRDAVQRRLVVSVHFATFADWWSPFEGGVGPAGAYVAGLADAHRDAVRERCHELLGEVFDLEVAAWTLTARPG